MARKKVSRKRSGILQKGMVGRMVDDMLKVPGTLTIEDLEMALPPHHQKSIGGWMALRPRLKTSNS